MNDSFSQLAKKIRLEKINKKEIQKIKREIIDQKVLNIIKTDMAIRIQKVLRSFLYLKKYYIFLEQKNTETIIDYLYEKRLNRIHTNSKKIIANHMLSYINNIFEEKEKKNKQKIHAIDLIKAVLRGIIFRKKFNKKKYSLKDCQNIIEKHILGYKIKLILRSNNIQSLLIDIANIRASLDNIDESNEANSQKIKELKTKLTKNINLFYFTFYQMKENSNWISQTKIQEPWIKKYMIIIYKDKYKDVYDNLQNNSNQKNIYSNQKKIKRLKEKNGNNKNNETKKEALRNEDYYNSKNKTISYDRENINLNSNMGKEALNTENNIYNIKKDKENKDNNSENLSGENDLAKSEKGYDFNFYDSGSDELDESSEKRKILHKGTEKYSNKNNHENVPKIKRIKSKQEDKNLNNEENINEERNIKSRSNINNKYKTKKNQIEENYSNNESLENKEKINLDDKEINEFNENENDIENEEREKEKIEEPKKLNKYQLREERPIKPLTNNNFLENENPFGLKRDSKGNLPDMNRNPNQNQSSNKKSLEKRAINTARTSKRPNIQKGYKELSETEKEDNIKTQEKTDLSHEENPVTNKYIEYDNRPCGGGVKNSAFYDFSKYDDSKPPEKLDRNERPLVGSKKIDYNAMFGNGGEEFEGDPFGGAKQFETNKDKVKNANIHKTNTVKKKPVYDARKAIEEAKLKEAKEGKKEKPSAFREFLREMKKISAEEKAQHNETITDNIKNDKKNKNKNNKKNDKKDNSDLNSNTESNIDKLENEEKIPKKNNKKQDKKLNLKKENEEKNEFTNSSNNILSLDEKDKENILKKKHRGSVILKGTETKEIALRRKLHELEKAPAPVLNIKGIKSRIECWNGSNENKRNKISNMAPRETPKSKDEKKSKINKQNDEKIISNFINNKKLNDLSLSKANNSSNINTNNTSVSSNSIPRIKKMEEKIEKYVEKKLMQLHLQIEEIDELFNLDKYFDEKEDKMKQYTSLPYIKETFSFVTKYSNKDYDEKINIIEKKYKELK